jgi:superfamily II DNA or RNA helicase
MRLFSSSPPFIWSANADGLAVRFSDPRRYAKAQEGRADEKDRMAFIRMRMLAECGQAEVREVDGGIFVAAADAVRLDKETRESFCLPPSWPGGIRLQTESVPQLPGFRARLGLVNPGARVDWDWQLRGPILEVGGAAYLPSAAQYAALVAYGEWERTTPHDEMANLCLLATLREAWMEGCHIDLEAYRETIVARADELSLEAREERETGDLILRPVVTGGFPSLDAERIEERIAQLRIGDERAILRVGKTIVLLDPAQTAQARAVAAHGRVPRKQREAFEKNPSAWLAENVFPDIETEFSPRVTGIGAWKFGYLGANWEEGQDWFQKQPEAERSERKPTPGPGGEGEDEDSAEAEPEGGPTAPIVPLIIPNDEELGFGWRFPELQAENAEPFELSFTRYAREPLPHQEDAVRWLLGHARRALLRASLSDNPDGFGAGALLADDMGLGKTFSTLMFLAEWFDLWRSMTSSEPPAVLIVAPLSLLENWKAEIAKSFWPEHRVFTRVLIAQSEGDLATVRRSPGSRDIVVPPGEVKQYGLGFGDGSERSLDYPGGCVLTTYQTLREYRFSFAKAEWSAAIFDEAQNIKNPNALQTISAKALKALFRLALTGTPVENHLGDFWSILDTAEPGPLGSFAEFKRNWILRMVREKERMAEVGEELRRQVGNLMLRRTKEEQLKGLPQKAGGADPILVDMTPEQTALYDTVIASAQRVSGAAEAQESRQHQNRQLAALWQLRQVSLHPDLLGGGNIGKASSPAQSRSMLQRSGKLVWLLQCLDRIQARGEKVLIFCVQKKLQEALSLHLGQIYGLSVPVINGDTKASSRRSSQTTRLGLIEQFSNQPGFGVCVLSPIAAGAGLNIVAANHVIHLERHWNPAKEDQATDRAYRIGQTRPVHVYLPTGKHPEVASFDLILHRLLDKKRGLQSALGLLPPEAVSAPELINEVFGQPGCRPGSTEYIDIQAALRLPWRLFEALIACLYEKEAQSVMLTSAGSDHGCDVVVRGWGPERENLLIQCNATYRDDLDSELAVREIEGARPFYEQALGITFSRRCLHTTARKFSRRTRRAAKLCGVTLYGRSWLTDMLSTTHIDRATVLAADGRRERI